jgi:hypothetical protein
MSALPKSKSSQAAIDRATAWNLAHAERRREIVRKNYYAHRQLKPKPTAFDIIQSRSMPVTESGCWLWTGKTNQNGYGELRQNKKVIMAHRFSWMAVHGEMPTCQVLHRCDVRCCVNPEHLFLGTHDDNMADMANKKRSTHGVKNWCTKLSEEDVMRIRSLKGKISMTKLANEYGVSHSGISRIQNYKMWKQLSEQSEVGHL